jgi:hypothetical protein
MKLVKFKKAGKWARACVRADQYFVEAGEVKELDDASAKIVVDAKAGEYVDPPEEEELENEEELGDEEPQRMDGESRRDFAKRLKAWRESQKPAEDAPLG